MSSYYEADFNNITNNIWIKYYVYNIYYYINIKHIICVCERERDRDRGRKKYLPKGFEGYISLLSMNLEPSIIITVSTK